MLVGRLSASWRFLGFTLPATCSHTIGHEIAMPMAGFKVQPP
jgi:hypothetical protein